MGAFTTYGRAQLMASYFLAPATVGDLYVALTSVIPGTTDDVTRLVEPIGNGYSRVLYAFTGGWEAGLIGEIRNARAITFPAPTANWGMMRGWALVTLATGGSVVVTGALKRPVTFQTGLASQVSAKSLTLTLR